MIFSKKILILIASSLAISIIMFLIFISYNSLAFSSKEVEAKFTVVLDAGHGGVDGGSVGSTTKIKESTLNLAIALKIQEYLEGSGIRVIMTRKDEDGLYGFELKNKKRKDMEKRKEIINGSNANLVVSIHMNKFPLASRRGAQVFFNKDSEQSKKNANNMQKILNEMPEMTKKTEALNGDFFILKCSNIPSVLVECGFLSNAEDEKLLMNKEYQNKLAHTIYVGIISTFE